MVQSTLQSILIRGSGTTFSESALWGGIVILGRAPLLYAVNSIGDAASPRYDIWGGLDDFRILDQPVHRFGGAELQDDSGSLRYVSIRHGGQSPTPDNVVSGLSLAGVGRATRIDSVEVVFSASDGFEFLGGSVDTRRLVSAFNAANAFSTDLGYAGRNQFWFAIQHPNTRGQGAEHSSEPAGLNRGTRSPSGVSEVFNATLLGGGSGSGVPSDNDGLLLHRSAHSAWHNSIIADFGGEPLTAGGPQSGAIPDITHTTWWNFAQPSFSDSIFTVSANNNSTNVNPLLRGIGRTPDGGLDPRPSPDSPALTANALAPVDAFYEPAPYRGAFNSRKNWLRGWSVLSQAGYLPPSDGKGTIHEVLASDPSFSTLVAAIRAAGLDDVFKGPGPLTIFAPSNPAFAALDPVQLADFLANPERLARVLRFHTLNTALKSQDLPSGVYVTLQGASVEITRHSEGFSVNGVPIAVADTEASNGFIHTIGNVLSPPQPQPISVLISMDLQGIRLSWVGGVPPFLIQSIPDFGNPIWTDVATVEQRSVVVPIEGVSKIYRVVSEGSPLPSLSR